MKRSVLERLRRLEDLYEEMRHRENAAERKAAHGKFLVWVGEFMEEFNATPPGPALSIEEERALLERLRGPTQVPPSFRVYARTRRR